MFTKKSAVIAISVLLILFLGWILTGNSSQEDVDIIVKPVVGEFVVSVGTSGELRAKNSTKIFGPKNARRARIWNMKISKLVEEGTVVKEGDFVAEIDRTELDGRIQDKQLSVEEQQSVVDQAILDSTLNLSQARDQLENIVFQLEDKKITLEQSTYESPAVQRQARIDYERTLRQLEQERVNYQTKIKQAEARIREVQTDLKQELNDLNESLALKDEFVIYAPQEGMIVYKREWNGSKVTSGSQINVFDPVVAELPDMRVMESVTYINEVDIKKIRKDQPVLVTMDAYPDKSFTGIVIKVANVGERRPNADSNVFEVIVEINESDSTLRPAMSTRNVIIVEEYDQVVSIPLESIHSNDKYRYVFIKDGISTKRREIAIGDVNDMAAIILNGLNINDKVLLNVPQDTVGLDWQLLDASLAESAN